MKFLLAVSLGVAMCIFSCNSTKKDHTGSPLEFSEKIVNIELALSEPLGKAEEMIRAQADSSRFEAMGKTAAEAEKLIGEKLDEIRHMKTSGYKGGEAFQQAAISYFQYIQSIYTNYRKIGEAKNDGARLAEVRKMEAIKADQPQVLEKMQAAQDKFAADNGFEIEKK